MAASELACGTCARRTPLDAPRTQCPCGGLLQVEYAGSAPARALFEARRGSRAALDQSGVWRFRERVDPGLAAHQIVSLREGGTPLYAHARLAAWAGVAELGFKHEGHNPTGSFKDRGMTVAVSRARAAGARRLACASTGNTAASLAAYSAAAGLPCVVLAPAQGTAASKLTQALACGAHCLLVRGDFDAALALLRAEAEGGDLALLNSINPFRIEGQKTVVFELLADLDWRAPDWIAFPAGNLGNCAAFGKALCEAFEAGWIETCPRLLAVQAAGAAPFAAAYDRAFDGLRPVRAETVASAIRIGAPASYERAVRAVRQTRGAVLAVSDAELLEAKAHIDRAGIGCEPASAAALAGLRRAVQLGWVAHEQSVVCVLTGHLLKDPQTTMAWHDGRVEPQAQGPRRTPITIEASAQALRAALEAL